MNLILFLIFILLLNIPFGYWRSNVSRFSFQWLMSVHFPIPFILLVRIYSDIGFELHTFIFSISVFFAGQFVGSQIYKFRNESGSQPLTSCLVMDLVRIKK